MDVDLSTDLNALLPLVAPLLSGHSDVAIGTRLARGSRVVRGPKREIISRCYNLLLRTTLRRRVLRRAVRVQGDPRRPGPAAAAAGGGHGLVLRHRAARARRARRAAHPRGAGGLDRRPRLPGRHRRRPRSATCAASPGSACGLARGDAQGATRCGTTGRSGRRAAGWPGSCRGSPPSACCPRWPTSCSTWRCAGSWARRRPTSLSLLLTAVANTAANRRLTFGVRGRAGAAGHQFRGLIVFARRPGAHPRRAAVPARGVAAPGRGAEVAVLVAANLVATALRFVLYRGWVFAPPTATPSARRRPPPRPVNPWEMRDERRHRHRSSPPAARSAARAGCAACWRGPQPTRSGRGRPCSACSPSPRCSTCGT